MTTPNLIAGNEELHPFEALQKLIQSDPEYAWGWLCNLAVPIMDGGDVPHRQANLAAALIMRQMFDYDITSHPRFQDFGYGKSSAQEYFELRVQAERDEDAQSTGEPV